MKKNSFKFKRKETGQILNIHHTVTTSSGELKRIRFLHVCFSDKNRYMAAVDSRGNCNVFDLKSMQVWVWHQKLPLCSTLKFTPNFTSKLIAGTRAGELIVLDVASGDLLQTIHPFVSKINNVSFPSSNADILLATTNTDAIIFNSHNLQQKHRLEYPAAEFSIKQMKFVNKSDQIYSIFSNDFIHIWTHENFRMIEHIHPIRLRENLLKNSKPHRVDLNPNVDDKVLVCNLTKDSTRGLISDVCFTDDGKHMCIATIDEYLMLFGTVTWDLIKLIHSPGTSILQSRFFTNCNTPDKMLISIVTLAKDAMIIDLNNLDDKFCIETEHTQTTAHSENGALMAVLLRTGEIQIFDVQTLIGKFETMQVKTNNEDTGYLQQWNKVNEKIHKTIPDQRLLHILKEFLEYPSQYRQLIWKTLLKLPDNRTTFTELLKKSYHPCVKDYDQLYPLKDISAQRNLKRIVSALAFWSKVFAQCEFIPKFVFPFVKEFDKNLIGCFETIITILLNHGQIWFEFAPLEPFNYLGMIENILAHNEPQLLRFYGLKNVTSKTYAWSLLKTAFTEVLDKDQWRQLWDHIISNSAEFLIFCIVGYNSVLKEVIMKLESKPAVERFFEEQNMIEMQRFLRKAYDTMEKCPDNLRPNRYLKAFSSLNTGFYDKFTNFPRALIAMKENEANKLMAENHILNDKLYELEKKELEFANRLENNLLAEEHTKRLRAVEKAYEDAIIREQDRVAIQRKHLLIYQKQLRESEQNMLKETRNSNLRRNLLEKETEVDILLKAFDRNRIREEGNLLFAEEDLKAKEMKLLLKKYDTDANMGITDEPLSMRYQDAIKKFDSEVNDLDNEMRSINNQNINICNDRRYIYDIGTTKTNAFERALEKMQIEFQNIKETQKENDSI